MDGAQVRVFREWIAQRVLIVHKEAGRFRVQLIQIEPGGEADLYGQVCML